MKFEVNEDIEIIVNNCDNIIKCTGDKSLDSLSSWTDIYEVDTIQTFKRL